MPAPVKFDLAQFIRQLAAYVNAKPGMAHRAYAAAARRVRGERNKLVNEGAKLEFQMVANKLDQMAATALVPEVEPEPFEVHSTHSDTLGDGIATEWDALVADIAASKVAASGTPNSDLVSAFLTDRMHAETMQAGALADDGSAIGAAQRVQINPAQSGKTLFGSDALVQFGGAPAPGTSNTAGIGSVPEQMVAQWSGIEEDARAITVMVGGGPGQGASFPAPVGAAGTPFAGLNLSYRPFFRLTFSAGIGQPKSVKGDIGRGVIFTVGCSNAYLSVGMDAPFANGQLGVGESPGSMYLGGSLSFFAVGRQQPITRTEYVDSINAGKTQTVIIPAFATTVELIMARGVLTHFTFSIQTVTLDSVGTLDTANPVRQVPLMDDAYSVLVTNTSGVSDSCAIVFGLSL